MVAAHAITTDATDADGGETGWQLCGADEQTGGHVLWVLVRCRSRRMSLPFSIPCRAINSQHTQHARDSFPFFFSHLLPFAPHCPERLGACTPDREDQETHLTPLGSFAVRNVHKAVTHIAGQMFVRAVLGADSQSRDSDIYDTSML
jgi:hypothetical protein